MKKYGIENCRYEVIEDGFTSLGKLALAEIAYIEKFNSYVDGLNSSRGGDGLGHHNWKLLSEDELGQIREALGNHFRDYNKKKWADTTPEQRKDMVRPAFTPEVNKRRAASLKEYYKATPEAVDYKINKLLEWQENNKNLHRAIVQVNGAKGAAKVSKKLKVETETGQVLYFSSKQEFNRVTGQWANTVIKKTKQGQFHNGYKVIEL